MSSPPYLPWWHVAGVPYTDDDMKLVPDAAPSATLRAIYTSTGFVDAASADDDQPLGLVLDRTSFYSEAGGQVPDIGELVVVDEAVFEVTNVQAFGGYVLHMGKLKSGSLTTGVSLSCAVDFERRMDVAKSHTVTHVLNHALLQVRGHMWNTRSHPASRCSRPAGTHATPRSHPLRAAHAPCSPTHTLFQVLGDGVSQKGSLADESKARFDFSHSKALTAKECAQVEALVQEQVSGARSVHTGMVPLDEAMAINGLRAVFGEKYPDPVRVVSVGPTVDELLSDPDNSECMHVRPRTQAGTRVFRVYMLHVA